MYMYNIFCMYAGGASAQVVGILGSQIQGLPVESGVGAPCCGVGIDVDMVVFLPSHEWEDLPLRL